MKNYQELFIKMNILNNEKKKPKKYLHYKIQTRSSDINNQK